MTTDSLHLWTATNGIYSALPLFDKLPLAVLAADESGRIIYTNEHFREIVGLPERSAGCCDTLSDLESFLTVDLRVPLERIRSGDRFYQSEEFYFTSTSGRFYLLTIILAPVLIQEHREGVFGILHDLTETADASESLKRRIEELNVIEEISQALHSSMKTDDILRMILIGATCREGLGFNRAFLFLVNESGTHLQGKVAIGPSSSEEAGRIWSGMDHQSRSLPEVLARYLDNVADYDVEANRIVRSLEIDLAKEAILRRVVATGKWYCVHSDGEPPDTSSAILQQLNTRHFVAVPLLSRGKTIGVILADNLITGKPIEDNTVRLLQIFADHAASAIENARLFEEAESKAVSLEKANYKLEQVQREIAAIEKSSLLAEVTYKIAHELRNPITIIGGFAALLNRGANSADKVNEYTRIIADETQRVEKALTDVLNFSKSFAEEKAATDLFDIAKATVDVLEQTHSRARVKVDPTSGNTDLLVRVNRDQTVQSLRDVIETLDSYLPQGSGILLQLNSAERLHRIELHFLTDPTERASVHGVLEKILKTKAEGSSLRMTLAFETIRYNGGEPGIAVGDGGDKYLYIAYPAIEEEYE